METSFQDFLQDCRSYKTVPIIEQYHVDMLTPIQIFQTLHKDALFILESNDKESNWSNYSFIGLDPMYFIRETKGVFELQNTEKRVLDQDASLSSLFQRMTERLKAKKVEIDVPFAGGAVGRIDYDAVSLFEKVPVHRQKNAAESVCELVICQTIIAFSHKENLLSFIHYIEMTGEEDEQTLKEMYEKGKRSIRRYRHELINAKSEEHIFVPSEMKQVSFVGVQSNYSKERFIDHVEKVKEYIRSGDIFQGVLSQRFEKEVSVNGLQLYRILRIINPSPYLFYIRLSDRELIGSSPERLIHVRDRFLEIHPIAGTRKRGKSKEEDEQIVQQLLQDEKELAEHYMLVDLARNDIGRVAEYGTVNTPVLLDAAYFSHVIHLISKVTGELAENVHPIDALISAFPAGTVSGAPKVRAMEIIHELEPTARSSYAGAVAYISFDGSIDSCIAIRTIQLQGNKAFVQAGAGIVADSVPECEWEETRNKASALIQTIQLAEQLFSVIGGNNNERNIAKMH